MHASRSQVHVIDSEDKACIGRNSRMRPKTSSLRSANLAYSTHLYNLSVALEFHDSRVVSIYHDHAASNLVGSDS